MHILPDFVQQLDVLLELPGHLSNKTLVFILQNNLRHTAMKELAHEHARPKTEAERK